jgi:magnesium transporter
MTPDFVDLRAGMTVAQALERIRRLAMSKETIYYAYVIDPQRQLLGMVSLKDLVLAPPEAVVGDLMRANPRAISTHTDQEEVAKVLRDYDLLAVPVVDNEGRLVGIVTWDDVLDIMEEEATEDIHRMAGLGVKERAATPCWNLPAAGSPGSLSTWHGRWAERGSSTSLRAPSSR